MNWLNNKTLSKRKSINKYYKNSEKLLLSLLIQFAIFELKNLTK